LRQILTDAQRHNPELLSIGWRDANGQIVFQSGDHPLKFQFFDNPSVSEQVYIPLLNEQGTQGSLELRFEPIHTQGWQKFLTFPASLIFFCGAMIILLNWSFLEKVLRKVVPSRIFPDRVRSAFDTLTDGLLLINHEQRIVMANQAFLKIVSEAGSDLVGRSISEFEWQFENGDESDDGRSPWERCLATQQLQRNGLVTLRVGDQLGVRYTVGATPIIGVDGACRGALVSFHDVTALELKKEQMSNMLNELSASRDEVQRKNHDLQVLASTDPLTGCLNRRSFFDRFAALWQKTTAPLAAMMVDIDYFKQINDTYGHATGDSVLQATGKLLLERTGTKGLVARYGGEEFVIVVEFHDADAPRMLAETILSEIRALQPAGLDVTMSIGVASREHGAADCDQLLEQADQCLYLAKREGRNRVVCWDEGREPESFIDEQSLAIRRSVQANWEVHSTAIQYPVVTAMLSALAFRDRDTAAHSSRVAKLCLKVGSRLLNKDELYELEIAALLHDVGKIGVPDAILRKPGPLTAEEQKVMGWHDEIGIEIIRSAFASEKITDFIRCHYRQLENPCGQALDDLSSVIPLGSRVLTVCDAFDSMTHEQTYRPAKSIDDALAELYDCTNGQFDPLVVRTLERVLTEANKSQQSPAGNALSKPGAPTLLELGAYVEHLSLAIANGDVDRLRELAKRVEATAANHNIDSVVQAAHRLEVSIDQNEASLNQLVGLADEIIELCRASRGRIIESPLVLRTEELGGERGR
jgi:diguanylate cyclase (GGDEF)-like protein